MASMPVACLMKMSCSTLPEARTNKFATCNTKFASSTMRIISKPKGFSALRRLATQTFNTLHPCDVMKKPIFLPGNALIYTAKKANNVNDSRIFFWLFESFCEYDAVVWRN